MIVIRLGGRSAAAPSVWDPVRKSPRLELQTREPRYEEELRRELARAERKAAETAAQVLAARAALAAVDREKRLLGEVGL